MLYSTLIVIPMLCSYVIISKNLLLFKDCF